MSPEQAKGEAVDGRSDLFSLGCVLYEMATGVSPFRTDSTMATLRRLVDESPAAMASHNPELPPWFIAIVERLLEKEPAKRFGSSKEVSELLEGCLAHVQQPANVPLPAGVPTVKSLAPATQRAPRRRGIRWVGKIAVMLVVGIGGGGALLFAATKPPNISGQWTGEGWNKVVLKRRNTKKTELVNGLPPSSRRCCGAVTPSERPTHTHGPLAANNSGGRYGLSGCSGLKRRANWPEATAAA